MSRTEVVFGFGAHSGIDDGPELLRMAQCTVFNFPGHITDRPAAATRDRAGRWTGGSVVQWVEELTGAVLEHGASGFTLFSPGGGTTDAVSLGRWANEVAPAVREAIAK
jgi:hypothetical protein